MMRDIGKAFVVAMIFTAGWSMGGGGWLCGSTSPTGLVFMVSTCSILAASRL